MYIHTYVSYGQNFERQQISLFLWILLLPIISMFNRSIKLNRWPQKFALKSFQILNFWWYIKISDFTLQVKLTGPIECRLGMLLLTSPNVTVLGGEVESLLSTNNQKHILSCMMYVSMYIQNMEDVSVKLSYDTYVWCNAYIKF